MTHDPLCSAPRCHDSVASCDECDPSHEPCRCQCELIAQVRFDMVQRVVNLSFYHNPSDPVEQGYNAGREIAIEVLSNAVVGS